MTRETLGIIVCFAILITGCNPPDKVSFTKDFPTDVAKGDIFTFIITVHNEDSKSHEVRSVDIEETVLEGVLITEVIPKVVEEYDVFGERIFEIRSDVAANSDLDVIFTAKAIKNGDFSGDLDVCVDGDASCIFGHARIYIEG
ncbi:MAG: hypothetical protein ABH879_08040 [archaeon]